MKGPGYTVNDLAFWTGLIVGLSCTYVGLTSLPAYHDVLGQLGLADWTRIITLVIGGLVGVALGGAAERVARSTGKKRPPMNDEHGEPPQL